MTQDEIYDQFWGSDPTTEVDKIKEAAEKMSMQWLLENYAAVKARIFAMEVSKIDAEFFKLTKDEAIRDIIEAIKKEQQLYNDITSQNIKILPQLNEFTSSRIHVGVEPETEQSLIAAFDN